MSRYYDYLLITYLDGTEQRIGGNETTLHDGVLTIFTRPSYGGESKDIRHFPIHNIRTWRWEKDS